MRTEPQRYSNAAMSQTSYVFDQWKSQVNQHELILALSVYAHICIINPNGVYVKEKTTN
jgi:hypothetical protein